LTEQRIPAASKAILKALPTGFVDDFPDEDRLALTAEIAKRVQLNGYDEDGRAELEFVAGDETVHFVFVTPEHLTGLK
jgi:hypothetical protein